MRLPHNAPEGARKKNMKIQRIRESGCPAMGNMGFRFVGGIEEIPETCRSGANRPDRWGNIRCFVSVPGHPKNETVIVVDDEEGGSNQAPWREAVRRGEY
jgi:hypothetical protein